MSSYDLDFTDIFQPEPGPFEEALEELLDTLRDKVKQEFKDEITRLKTALAEVEDYRLNRQAYERELDQVKRDCQNKVANMKWEMERVKAQAMSEAKRLTLEELLGDFSTECWTVYNKGKMGEKCSQCDDERYITFFSPAGKKLREPCKCAKRFDWFVAEKMECTRISYSPRKDQKIHGAFTWHDNDDRYTNNYETFYDGKTPFDEMKVPNFWRGSSPLFNNRETAQAFADYLNENVASRTAKGQNAQA